MVKLSRCSCPEVEQKSWISSWKSRKSYRKIWKSSWKSYCPIAEQKTVSKKFNGEEITLFCPVNLFLPIQRNLNSTGSCYHLVSSSHPLPFPPLALPLSSNPFPPTKKKLDPSPNRSTRTSPTQPSIVNNLFVMFLCKRSLRGLSGINIGIGNWE